MSKVQGRVNQKERLDQFYLGESWKGGEVNEVGKNSQRKWHNLIIETYILNADFSHLGRRTTRQLLTWKKIIHRFLFCVSFFYFCHSISHGEPTLIGDLCVRPKSVWMYMIYMFNSPDHKLKVHFALSPFLCFSKWNVMFFLSWIVCT